MSFEDFLPIIALQALLVAIALVHLVRRDARSVRDENKWLWAVVIVVINIIGPIIYFVWGRKD
ncbi:hypothetical protein PA598K_00829 [Paenibacillus sp. 598K]|uniref:PLDc N-terminal domain-containing protein n=1 Tax=Paenibacillus sp. 598K TaxID=1117987 RepID=UPI000FF9FDAA|nr:PLDc N-terminal domain-containing protein [Paenibacillus sp. 598K]GBF72572.1 hypothetical protein PA598K_00829 [Paenibacillus sp. 598K]